MTASTHDFAEYHVTIELVPGAFYARGTVTARCFLAAAERAAVMLRLPAGRDYLAMVRDLGNHAVEFVEVATGATASRSALDDEEREVALRAFGGAS